jgi:hypothetical protein
VWLGLSQLHTLHDVDLDQVSVAAIAAALPRLHTLTAHRYCDHAANDSVVAGFFTDLLPRLRVFRFCGKWSTAIEEPVAAPAPLPLPLPLLEELGWDEDDCQPTLLCGFLEARPMVLHVPYELVAECLPGRNGARTGESARGLLTRARELYLMSTVAPIEIADVAQLLRSAPQLRNFRTELHIHGDTSWLTASDAPLAPAFVDLIHPRLRCFDASAMSLGHPSSDEGCASRLQRACFPRLEKLAVAGTTYFMP